MPDHLSLLKSFLSQRGQPEGAEALTADASTREYFRVEWHGATAIACVYPEPFDPATQTYLDVTRLFMTAGLPVPKTLDFDGALGIIVQEDLGDTILRDQLTLLGLDEREARIDEAITMIARIQAATGIAYELDSIAGRLKFDTEKLLWELNFFKTHYFETFKKEPLPQHISDSLETEFIDLANELASRASVLCHRDFHSANLMIDAGGSMRIIDHQDARIGSPAYDLVSLLLDRITELPEPDWLRERQQTFLRRRQELGLAFIDLPAFSYEFDLQTIQRCLKAAGTFSFQSVNRGKTYFIPFIKPMFRISLRAARDLDRFPVLQATLERELV